MSVLVIGMEMPKSCWNCDIGPAFQLDNNHCPFYEMEGWEQENYQNKIADGCPISYVPPHGDLIDRDELIENGELVNENTGLYSLQGISMESINIARTIIKAEQ